MEHKQTPEKDMKVILQDTMESEGTMHAEKSISENQAESLIRINDEFKKGFDFLKKFNATVSFFGSARFSENDPHSKAAEILAAKIVHELGYAVITGGGPGIMQAANKGANEAGGDSLGIMIKLPLEQRTNAYVKEGVECQYFFTRKTILTFAAEAYIFFPGGFGTMDELFEVATLIQNKKIPRVPVILVGKDFWEPFIHFIRKNLLERHNAILGTDLDIFKITEDHDEIISIIKTTPVVRWWRNIER